MALKLNFVKGRGYQSWNRIEVKKEHKKEARADEKTVAQDEQKAPTALVTVVNNVLPSIFFNNEV